MAWAASNWAWAAVTCLSAAMIPALAFSMSEAVDFSWLEVFTEVIGTVIFSDWAVASALARLACAWATATS